MNNPPLPKTVAVDLDGTLTAYKGEYRPGYIDPPLPGAKEFLEALRLAGYRIAIYSTRVAPDIRRWLHEHNLYQFVDEITQGKPLAVAYIDERAIQFRGDFEAVLNELDGFTAYWEKGT